MKNENENETKMKIKKTNWSQKEKKKKSPRWSIWGSPHSSRGSPRGPGKLPHATGTIGTRGKNRGQDQWWCVRHFDVFGRVCGGGG